MWPALRSIAKGAFSKIRLLLISGGTLQKPRYEGRQRPPNVPEPQYKMHGLLRRSASQSGVLCRTGHVICCCVSALPARGENSTKNAKDLKLMQ